MPAKKIPSLHHNLEFQDPYTGGKNVIFHRSHRTKKGRRDHHYLQDADYWAHLEEKMEEFTQREEKKWEKLAS